MVALIDFYYLDEFGQVTTLDRLLRAIRDAGVSTIMVNETALIQKLAEVAESQLPMRWFPFAQGRLPESGHDAEVQFYLQAVADRTNVDVLHSSRRVAIGDLLCRKTSATIGARAGINVLGQSLPARPGLDIRLTAGGNTTLSLDGLDIVADSDGVVEITRAHRQIRAGGRVKEFAASVLVSVNPLLRVDAENIINLTTSRAVEVTGNLRVGSRVISESEVYVTGDVESGASITAADSVLVQGSVTGATLSSQRDIQIGESVDDSRLQAVGDVGVRGSVRNSAVIGENVQVGSITGSRLVARNNVTVDSVGSDEDSVISTICIGMQEFFAQRLIENQRFLEAAQANLERIRLLIGDELFERIDRSNTQTIFMRLLSRLRIDNNANARKQADMYRQLIEAVPPTRALILRKEAECRDMARRITDHVESTDGIMIVKQNVAATVAVSISGRQGAVGPSDVGVTVTTDGQTLQIQPNPV
jgi:uncharacterized protein (DUF342 family)